eukprot:4575789-Amphidinium_carterae.1
MLANSFDSKADVKTSFYDRLTEEQKQTFGLAALANLRQAWREAEASTESGIQKVSAGLPEAALDEPLRSEVSKNLSMQFFKLHNFLPPPAWTGPPSMLGRFHREFEKFTHVIANPQDPFH